MVLQISVWSPPPPLQADTHAWPRLRWNNWIRQLSNNPTSMKSPRPSVTFKASSGFVQEIPFCCVHLWLMIDSVWHWTPLSRPGWHRHRPQCHNVMEWLNKIYGPLTILVLYRAQLTRPWFILMAPQAGPGVPQTLASTLALHTRPGHNWASGYFDAKEIRKYWWIILWIGLWLEVVIVIFWNDPFDTNDISAPCWHQNVT